MKKKENLTLEQMRTIGQITRRATEEAMGTIDEAGAERLILDAPNVVSVIKEFLEKHAKPKNEYKWRDYYEIFIEHGAITEEQANTERQKRLPESYLILKSMVKSGIITYKMIAEVLAKASGVETIDLTSFEIQPDIVQIVPRHVARRYNIVPIKLTDDRSALIIALSDPFKIDTIDSLNYILKTRVIAVVAPMDELEKAVEKYYPPIAGSIGLDVLPSVG